MSLGPWEIAILLLVVVIIFGAGRLAEFGGAFRKSTREARGAARSAGRPARAVTAQVVSTPPVICPTCQTSNLAANKFCSGCGADLAPSPPPEPAQVATDVIPAAAAPPSAENTCPSCATVNPPGQVFCGQCGTRLTRAA
jgi:hypothetical protein